MSDFINFWAPVSPAIGFFLIIAALTVLARWVEKWEDRASTKRYVDWLTKHPGGTYRQYLKELGK